MGRRTTVLLTPQTLAIAGNLTVGGSAYFVDGSAAAPSISFSGDTDTGVYRGGSGIIGLSTNGVGVHVFSATSYNFRSDSATIAMGTADDLFLVRDAANVLALKNGTTAQEFRVYGTTTGPSYLSLQGGDSGGAAGCIAVTTTSSSVVTNTYVVKGGQISTTPNTGWIKIYRGTAAAWIPIWENATP